MTWQVNFWKKNKIEWRIKGKLYSVKVIIIVNKKKKKEKSRRMTRQNDSEGRKVPHKSVSAWLLHWKQVSDADSLVERMEFCIYSCLCVGGDGWLWRDATKRIHKRSNKRGKCGDRAGGKPATSTVIVSPDRVLVQLVCLPVCDF